MKTFPFFDKVLNLLKGTTADLADAILKAEIVTLRGDSALTAAYNGKIIEAIGTITITLPSNLDNGFNCSIVNVGSGIITLAVEQGTLRATVTTITTQYNAATVYKSSNILWTAIGGLS